MNRYTIGCALALGLAMASAGQPAKAAFPRPLPVGNQSPVMSLFGIPKAQSATLPARGELHWDATVEQTSHFQASEAGGESIVLDGETTRVSIQGRYGIGDNWSVGVEVPWVRHGPGFLDHFIVEWHDTWGFPQNGRDRAAEDALVYRYTRDGETRFNIESATGGLGDMIVSAQRELWRGQRSAGVLHAQLKLPTGDPDNLSGSGAADAAAGFELSRRWHDDWHSMFRAGAAYLGEGDVLPDLQRRQAIYGGLDLTWRPLGALSFRVQYDAHTSPYGDSELGELSRWSGMLSTGGTWHIGPTLALDLAVVENVPNSRAVSDVSFQVRLRSTADGML
ncbi:MAG TPA: DUF3187 family protein [Arenicellales bacterium]|nr:DUF3187 family protein [Arenicellales bacterium]